MVSKSNNSLPQQTFHASACGSCNHEICTLLSEYIVDSNAQYERSSIEPARSYAVNAVHNHSRQFSSAAMTRDSRPSDWPLSLQIHQKPISEHQNQQGLPAALRIHIPVNNHCTSTVQRENTAELGASTNTVVFELPCQQSAATYCSALRIVLHFVPQLPPMVELSPIDLEGILGCRD